MICLKVKWAVRRTKGKGGWATGVLAERGPEGENVSRIGPGGLPWHRRISAAPGSSAGEQGGIMRCLIRLYSKLPSTPLLSSPARCPPHP